MVSPDGDAVGAAAADNADSGAADAFDVDALVRDHAAEHGIPSIVVGVLRDGGLASVHATGTRIVGADAPTDADTVYRIASMTKSFTAAAVLLLRDRGLLRLDDPAAEHLPWLGDRRISVRDLLTMNAGLPTDDPWGDRHEPTEHEVIQRLVEAGIPRIHEPRGGFEYSNLGYALLGRLITAVDGREYTDVIAEEFLAPLGMTATAFDHHRIPDEHRARGYAPTASGLVEEPQVTPGAFSPMGGLHTSVRDLSRWVQGLLDAFLAPDRPHPLTAASRREQQQPANFARLITRDDGTASAISYGMGLMAEEHSRAGRFVFHSGGYPGFGSHMRWHPATGTGVIILSNRTYGPLAPLVEQLALGIAERATPVIPVRDRLWPATLRAMDAVEGLLAQWDDVAADALFAHNVDLDEPRAERADEWREARDAIGAFTRDEASLQSRTPAQATWRVTGERGSARLDVLMSPDTEPLVQSLRVVLDRP